MLQIIKECIEKIQQAPLQYKQIASCKFLSVINPNETPELELSLTIKKNETDTFQILAEGASSKDICIKLKAQTNRQINMEERSEELWHEKARQLGIVVIIPTYN